MYKKVEQKVLGYKTVNTFVYLKKASQLLIDEAKENSEGSAYKYMVSMLTSAFSLEAYINHLGREKFNQEENQWQKWERQSTCNKLNDLANKINYKINYNTRPFETFKEIFEFRNSLAHGKTGEYEVDIIQEVDDKQPVFKQIPEAKWEPVQVKKSEEQKKI